MQSCSEPEISIPPFFKTPEKKEKETKSPNHIYNNPARCQLNPVLSLVVP